MIIKIAGSLPYKIFFYQKRDNQKKSIGQNKCGNRRARLVLSMYGNSTVGTSLLYIFSNVSAENFPSSLQKGCFFYA